MVPFKDTISNKTSYIALVSSVANFATEVLNPRNEWLGVTTVDNRGASRAESWFVPMPSGDCCKTLGNLFGPAPLLTDVHGTIKLTTGYVYIFSLNGMG